jgi:GntR family transcriptional regulator of vanillate catabolism
MTPQSSQAVVSIRELILRDELTTGESCDRSKLADLISVPFEALERALPALAAEGLLVRSDGGDYVVHRWCEEDVIDLIDMRGALEGLAARKLAEGGASTGFLTELRDCLRCAEGVFQRKRIEPADKAIYAEMNRRFHALIVDEAASPRLSDALARNQQFPFAGAQAVAFERNDSARAYEILAYAHRQHYAIIDALENGQGQRAEMLMREHVSPVKDALGIRKPRAEGTEVSRPVAFIQSTRRRIAGSRRNQF